MLYAHGQRTVELDDVMAVVADASALALDALVDAAFAGRIADVEKEFSKAMVAGTAPYAIVGAALRQVERLHTLRLGVESGSSASPVIERVLPPIHFRRKTSGRSRAAATGPRTGSARRWRCWPRLRSTRDVTPISPRRSRSGR